MKKLAKKRKEFMNELDLNKKYEVVEAIKILKENSYVKFNETLDVAINLSVDPNKTDQNIRGMINLPHGTGKNIKVAVMTKGDKVNEAKDSGADMVVMGAHRHSGWKDYLFGETIEDVRHALQIPVLIVNV